MSTQAFYDFMEQSKQHLAADLDTTTEVIEAYLGNKEPAKKIYVGGGEILPCWPMEQAHV